MKGRRLAAWLLVLGLASCGPDGGSSGTGITGGTSGTGIASQAAEDGMSIVQGNLSTIREAKRTRSEASILFARLKQLFEVASVALAEGGLEGVRVIVEGTGADDWTDEAGTFSVSGSFDGTVTVLFERAGETARLSTVVPSGGTLTLDDVTIDYGSGTAAAETDRVMFEAVVVGTDCPNQTVFVTSRFDPDGRVYEVHTDGAALRSSDGRELGCSELGNGDGIVVEGPIATDGTVGSDGSRDASEALGPVGL